MGYDVKVNEKNEKCSGDQGDYVCQKKARLLRYFLEAFAILLKGVFEAFAIVFPSLLRSWSTHVSDNNFWK